MDPSYMGGIPLLDDCGDDTKLTSSLLIRGVEAFLSISFLDENNCDHPTDPRITFPNLRIYWKTHGTDTHESTLQTKTCLSNRVPHTRTPDRSMNEWMKLYLDDCKTTAARNVSPAIGPFVYLSQRQHITWVSYLPQYILVQTHTLGDASRSQNQPAVQKQSNQNGQRCENVNVILWLDSLIKMCEKPGLTLTLGVPIHAKKTSQSDFEFTVFMQLILFV